MSRWAKHENLEFLSDKRMIIIITVTLNPNPHCYKTITKSTALWLKRASTTVVKIFSKNFFVLKKYIFCLTTLTANWQGSYEQI
jgi:hypothetical protein